MIGKRIRELRKESKYTLKDLAAKVGCTDAFISQIEREIASPSISTLKKIANALDVSLVELVEVIDETENEDTLVIKENNRINFNLHNDSVKCEILTRDIKSKNMEPLHKVVKPGGGTKGLYSHSGEEFGIVLKGRLVLTVNNKTYDLGEGDAFYFKSTDKHGYENKGNIDCELIWVISPPTF